MSEPISIDITDTEALARAAEEVGTSRKRAILTRGDKAVAMLVPLRKPTPKRRAVSKADYDAFLSSAGGWKGIVDVDKFLKDNAESRRISTRPPVKL